MSESPQPWVEGLTIGQVLRQTADRFPDADALVFPQFNTRLTYREFDQQVDSVARSLLALGLQQGDHIAIWATNWPQWVLLQFASARIGVVLVCINPAYRSSELAYVLKQSDTLLHARRQRLQPQAHQDQKRWAEPEPGYTKPWV